MRPSLFCRFQNHSRQLLSSPDICRKTAVVKRVINASFRHLAETPKTAIIAVRFQSVCVVLEAFGNAKTLRNVHSSRFGSCARLQLDPNSGGTAPLRLVIDTFLLDAARCVRQPRSERGFHILYQLCAGALPADECAGLYLAAADSFACLNSSGTIFAEGVDDRQSFADTVAALESIGLDTAGRAGLWRLLAAVLHLSNVRFVEAPGGASELEPTSCDALQHTASILGVNPDALLAAMVQRVAPLKSSGGSQTRAPQSPVASAHCRDALATCLYSRVFAALVAMSNAALSGAGLGGDAQSRIQGGGASSTETAAAVVAAIRAGQQLQGATNAPVVEFYDLLGAENLASNGFHALCANYGDVSEAAGLIIRLCHICPFSFLLCRSAYAHSLQSASLTPWCESGARKAFRAAGRSNRLTPVVYWSCFTAQQRVSFPLLMLRA